MLIEKDRYPRTGILYLGGSRILAGLSYVYVTFPLFKISNLRIGGL